MEKKQLIKETIKSEIRKMLKEEFTEIDELARIAKTLKIVDKDKAQQVIDKFKGGKKTWIADMIEKVIEAGDEGIAQVALAKAIGKVDEFGDGRQQAINPEVRSLLGAGIFTFGEAGVPVANTSSEPEISSTETETSKEEINEPTTETSEDDEDIEIEDEYEKIDAEDQGEDEEELAKKISPNPKLQKKSSELDNVIKDLKKLAKEYTDAKKDGDKEKEKDLIAKLKAKNSERDKLLKTLDKDLSTSDED